MKTMIRIAAICLSVAAGVAAVNTSPAAAADKRVAALLGPNGDTYIGAWSRAFSQSAGENGFKVTVFESPSTPPFRPSRSMTPLPRNSI